MGNAEHRTRISRRTLLKVIAAAGGSLAASTMLPGKWVKPVLKVGVLPVHAQTSTLGIYHIVSSTASYFSGDGCLSNLSATITPAASGISMQVIVCDMSVSPPACAPVGTAATVSGLATFDDPYTCFGSTPIRVTITFTNASDCDGTTCSMDYLFP
jgi:hypothetical protein